MGNVVVDLVDRETAFSLILDSLSAPSPLAVVSANLHHLHCFAEDGAFRQHLAAPSAIGQSSGIRWLTLLDGIPLVRAANSLTGSRWPKLSGSDLIDPILESVVAKGARIGVLGGQTKTHMRLRALLNDRFPTICIAGMWAPTRAELTQQQESERIAREICDAAVDVLIVALGKPLQEQWIARYGTETGAKVLLAFGAAIDFLANRVPRAPDWVVGAGAEWLWRLILEPRRLGRRYLIEGPPAYLHLKRSARIVEPAFPFPAKTDRPKGTFVSLGAHAEVAVVVVTYNSSAYIPLLVDDLRASALDHGIRVVMVDNASSDGTADLIRANDDIILIEPGGNLGYPAGINQGLTAIGDCGNVLILNSDLRLMPEAIDRLLAATDGPGVGAVVPLMLNDDGTINPSLCREPSLSRALGDALLGSRLQSRPGFLSEFDHLRRNYLYPRDVDWATGAALLIPADVAREVGDWWGELFIYSEEVDYFRRIRMTGRVIRFEPTAVVMHRGAGSGNSLGLKALKCVNHLRYVEKYHGRVYSAVFRAIAVFAIALRCRDASNRYSVSVMVNRRRWRELPTPFEGAGLEEIGGSRHRGAVIIPANNEEAVIGRVLVPLSRAAVDGFIELIVVCNGCTDKTADLARHVPGVRVLEIDEASKPAALNVGDRAASLWPRLYLDADVRITARSVLAVLDRLTRGDVLAAAPTSRYDSDGATALVRSYYRARDRVTRHKSAMWEAGAYGLNEEGHRRFGSFPPLIGDDLYVDTRFDSDEKVVVATEPSVRKTPTKIGNLLDVMRRHRRGGAELLAWEQGRNDRVRDTGLNTVLAVVKAIGGPRSAWDAAVYLSVALLSRRSDRGSVAWERDETSRS